MTSKITYWKLPRCIEALMHTRAEASDEQELGLIEFAAVVLLALELDRASVVDHVAALAASQGLSLDDDEVIEIVDESAAAAETEKWRVVATAVRRPKLRRYDGCPLQGENKDLHEICQQHCDIKRCFLGSVEQKLGSGTACTVHSHYFEFVVARGKTQSHESGSNFIAWIEAELIPVIGGDDLHADEVAEANVEATRYRLRGVRGGRPLPPIIIERSKFRRMDWPHMWGAETRVMPFATRYRDRVADAVQAFSAGLVKKEYEYYSVGWKRHRGLWIFIHAGGALFTPKEIEVTVPDKLKHYNLSEKNVCSDADAIRSMLSVLEAGTPAITYTGLCAVLRAPFSSIQANDYLIHFIGSHQKRKSVFVALLLSFFGEFGGREGRAKLPAHWSDSIANLRDALNDGCDVIMAIDDLHPNSTANEKRQAEENFNDIARMFGNMGAGGRQVKDAKGRWTSGPVKRPRGLGISTGERVPSVESALGRTWIVPVKEGDLDLDVITRLQEETMELQQAMRWYLGEIAERLNRDDDALREDVRYSWQWALQVFEGRGLSGRQAEIPAHLLTGLIVFADFAVKAGHLPMHEREEMVDDCVEALCRIGGEQTDHISAESAEVLFFQQLDVALLGGEGRLVDVRNSLRGYGSQGGTRELGYYDAEYVYLIGTLAFRYASEACTRAGGTMPLGYKDLAQRLVQAGIALPGREGEKTIPTQDLTLRIETILKGGRKPPRNERHRYLVMRRETVAEYITGLHPMKLGDILGRTASTVLDEGGAVNSAAPEPVSGEVEDDDTAPEEMN